MKNIWTRIKERNQGLFDASNLHLLFQMISADFKIQNYNSILGNLWSLIGPIATTGVLYFTFNNRFTNSIHAYPLFILTGVVMVNFFIACTTSLTNIFYSYRHLFVNSMVSRDIIILSSFFTRTYKFIIDLILCMLLSAFYGFFSFKTIFLIMPIVGAYIVIVLAISMLLAMCNCFMRDTTQIWALTGRLFLFITPIFYTLNSLSRTAQMLIYYGNPITPFTVGMQRLFMGSEEGIIIIYAHSIFLSLIFFAIAYYVFIRLENIAVERV